MDNEMKVITTNKKAFFNFFISDLVEAGIELKGSEVKSIRVNGMSLNESFVLIKNDEIFLKNAYIKPYEHDKISKIDERRTRKLLLHKAEIVKLGRKVQEKGFSLMAIKAYFDKGKVKISVGLAKGKHLYDKRATEKEGAVKKELRRVVKEGGR